MKFSVSGQIVELGPDEFICTSTWTSGTDFRSDQASQLFIPGRWHCHYCGRSNHLDDGTCAGCGAPKGRA